MPFIPDVGQSAIPFRRRATIRISDSWPTPLLVPPGVLDLVQTAQWVSFPHLFAHVADRTAPPTGYGFSLAETWALARYLGAVAGVADFSLSLPWDDLDSHQKTILSDDWGVGMASLVATAAFQPTAIANTGEWLRRSAGVASANRAPRKRGPAKSPDFAFEDARGVFNLVEAKGTQGSVKALLAQLEDGRDQKENITFHDPSVEGVRLVVGTRIPVENSGCVEVIVGDPPLDLELPTDKDRARAWLRRVGLAGACRAAGLPTWADALLNADGLGGLRGQAERELRIRSSRRVPEDLAGRETVVILPRPLEGRSRDWRLVLGMSVGLLYELLETPDLDAVVTDPLNRTEASPVQRDLGASGIVSAVTPNSLHFRMEEL
jgi:hypothetical protein